MENNLKSLSRMELLQVLLQVTESNEALIAENAELKSASSMQVSRSAKVGSIAEAALKVNGFFEAAQRSADDYLREVKKLRDEMIERSKAQMAAQASQGVSAVSPDDELEQSQLFERIQDQAKTYIQDVQTYANNVMARANSQAQGIIDDARMRSDEIIAEANDQARVIIEKAEERAAQKEASLADLALPLEQSEAVTFEEEQIEYTASLTETSGEEQFAAESFVAGQSEAEALEVEQPEPITSVAEALETEQPANEVPEMVIPGREQPEGAAISEKTADEELPLPMETESAGMSEELVDELITEDGVFGEGSIDEESFAEAELSDDLSARDAEAEVAQIEESSTEELREAASQSTVPLNIDVIVSDIAASAFSETELDPGSTGALVRRGRHVKIPEGMTM